MQKRWVINVNINLSWSKIMATVVFIGGFHNGEVSVVTIAIIFGTGLIMGKQFFDSYFNSPRNISLGQVLNNKEEGE